MLFKPLYKNMIIILYVALFTSIIAQLDYAKGISLIGTNRGSFAINLLPVFGSLSAIIILHEHFRWFHLISLILILGGIWLSKRFAPTKQQYTSK